jgi:hypothetical protein
MTVRRIGCKAALERVGELSADAPERLGRALLDCREQCRDVVGLERPTPEQNLPRSDTERELIARGVGALAAQLLRRHVRGSAE